MVGFLWTSIAIIWTVLLFHSVNELSKTYDVDLREPN
jgi:hypothetical protein